MPSKDLIVIMAGDGSLQHEFCASDRSFAVWTIYYGDDDAVATRLASISDRFFRATGLKLALARHVLIDLYKHEPTAFDTFDYVFFPDDDLHFPEGGKTIEKFFAICHALEVDVAQPSIVSEHDSVAWEPTRARPDLFCARTNITEFMMPLYSRRMLTGGLFAALHAMEFVKSGWGLESIIQRIGEMTLCRPLYTYVIHAIRVEHTRPVGTNGLVHRIGKLEAFLIPQLQTNRIRNLREFNTFEEAQSDRHSSEAQNWEPFAADQKGIESYLARKERLRRVLEIARPFVVAARRASPSRKS